MPLDLLQVVTTDHGSEMLGSGEGLSAIGHSDEAATNSAFMPRGTSRRSWLGGHQAYGYAQYTMCRMDIWDSTGVNQIIDRFKL